jgi:Tfp pilus assembly protein PilO
MTSLSRVFREKRSLILPLTIAAVANLAALGVLVYPLSRRVDATEQRAADVKVRLARASNDFRAARATLEGRARTDTQLARFYAEVLPRDQAAARRITYLKLAQLARDANLVWDHRSFRPETEKESTLARMNMTIELHGQYRDMRQFIHTLETAPEFIVIRDVALSKEDEDQQPQRGRRNEPMTLTLHLATYYRAPGSEAATDAVGVPAPRPSPVSRTASDD